MATANSGSRGARIQLVHAVLLASSLPLFVGSLLSDWAYSITYEVQWINFAAWLITGALLFAGSALFWVAADLVRAGVGKDRQRVLYALVLLATFVVGFFNAIIHAKDAWATMPAGLILSLVGCLLALASVALGFSTLRRGGAR